MARPAKETRDNFESGKCDGWSAGGHGRKVRVYAEGGKLWLRFKRPDGRRTPIQVYDADTKPLRVKAAASAATLAERLRSGHTANVERSEKSADDLTVWDVVMLYMRRAPGFPEEAFDPTPGGGGAFRVVERWYETLPPGVKRDKTVPKASSLWTDVYAFRRLFQDPRFARTRKVMTLDPADATNYVKDTAARGGSPRTPVNDVDRLSCAIRYVQTQYRRTYQIPYNPIEGRIVDRTRAEVPEFSRKEVNQLLRAIEEGKPGPGQWQVGVAVGIAHSGRRIGSILALTMEDHDLAVTKDAPFGRVTWQAEHAKGEAYERGDVTLPMTEEHRTAVEWAMQHHPNPKGAAYPILWQTKDPTQHIGEQTIDAQFRRLQKAAGVTPQPRRAFHGFCRSVITWLADLHGDGVAAEFTGRNAETIRRYSYKKVQDETMGKAVTSLSKKRKERDR